MLQICQFFILNAAPMAMDAGRADPHFQKCHIRAQSVCVCVCDGREGVNKSMEFSNFLGHIFFTTPLYLHTEMFSLGTEEEIRKLCFDDEI